MKSKRYSIDRYGKVENPFDFIKNRKKGSLFHGTIHNSGGLQNMFRFKIEKQEPYAEYTSEMEILDVPIECIIKRERITGSRRRRTATKKRTNEPRIYHLFHSGGGEFKKTHFRTLAKAIDEGVVNLCKDAKRGGQIPVLEPKHRITSSVTKNEVTAMPFFKVEEGQRCRCYLRQDQIFIVEKIEELVRKLEDDEYETVNARLLEGPNEGKHIEVEAGVYCEALLS